MAAVAGGRLYIHGGYCDEQHLGDTWVLDTASWKWQRLLDQVRGCTHALCYLCWVLMRPETPCCFASAHFTSRDVPGRDGRP